jgi:hypothetical protein
MDASPRRRSPNAGDGCLLPSISVANFRKYQEIALAAAIAHASHSPHHRRSPPSITSPNLIVPVPQSRHGRDWPLSRRSVLLLGGVGARMSTCGRSVACHAVVLPTAVVLLSVSATTGSTLPFYLSHFCFCATSPCLLRLIRATLMNRVTS